MATVELIQQKSGDYQLLVDGKPYFIQGAGLEFGPMSALAACGGNTLRTWRVANGQQSPEQVLDEAEALGLKVCMGLELARERHGFDYSDAKAVAAQHADIMRDVQRLKDHPALIMWGLGNELNLRARNPRVWDAVDALCQSIKTVDPDHLLTTMLAGVDAPTLAAISARAPSLDLLSFQLYGEIDQLPELLAALDYAGPYQITEWGPTGHWESPLTDWGRPIEATSHGKAEDIARRYRDVILQQRSQCLGSYIFLWGQKQERTPTWYGLFLDNGRRTEAVDVMEHAWTGHWPEQRCPQIEDLLLNRKTAAQGVTLEAGSEAAGEVVFTAAQDSACSLFWQVREEVDHKLESDGGDFEPTPPCLIKSGDSGESRFVFEAPQPGEYRLYCQVDDNGEGSAVANIPFLVTPPEGGAAAGLCEVSVI